MARGTIKIEFSEESLAAIREMTERLAQVGEKIAALRPDDEAIGKAVARQVNRAAMKAKRVQR